MRNITIDLPHKYVILTTTDSNILTLFKVRKWWQRWFTESYFMSVDIDVTNLNETKLLYSPQNKFLLTNREYQYSLCSLASSSTTFILTRLGHGSNIKPTPYELTFYATDTIIIERILDLDNADDCRLIIDNNRGLFKNVAGWSVAIDKILKHLT